MMSVRAITALGRRVVWSSCALRYSASREADVEPNARFCSILNLPHFSRHSSVLTFSSRKGLSTDATVEPVETPADTREATADSGKGKEINHKEQLIEKMAQSLSPNLTEDLMKLYLDERTAVEFLRWAGGIKGFKIYQKTISSVAKSWTSEAKLGKLECLLEEFKRKGGQAYEPAWALMMRVRAHLNNVNEVVRTFSDMKESGCKPSALTYHILLRVFLFNNQLDDAVATWREMLSTGVILDTFTVSTICFVLEKVVALKEAIKFLAEMAKWDQISKHSGRLNKLLSTLTRKASPNEIQKLFTELVSAGFVPNIHSYAVLVASFYLDGKFEEAKKLLEEMTKMGSSPNVSTFGTIIEFLREAGKWEEVLDIMGVMTEYGCTPNSFVHTQRIHALFATGKTHDAEEALNEMSKEGCTWNAETYGIMSEHYCKEGMVDRALDLRTEMCKTGCKADVTFYQVLVDGLCNANRIVEAIEILPDMRDKGCRPNADVYRIIVSQIGKLEDDTTAHRLMTKLIQRGTGEGNCITLLEVLCEMERFQEAEELYCKMSQKLDDKPKCLEILVIALCRARKFNKALGIIRRKEQWQGLVLCEELIKILFEQTWSPDALPASETVTV